MPLMTTRPMASGQVTSLDDGDGEERVDAQPCGQPEREVAPPAPNRMVMTPAVSPVTAPTWAADSQPPATSVGAFSALKPPRISGFRITMYAMVKKVTSPPRNSRARVEPRRVIWKKRSSAMFDAGELGRA